MQQFFQPGHIHPELRARNVRNPRCAARILRVEELPHRLWPRNLMSPFSDHLSRAKLRLILRSRKRRLMMIEPPRYQRRGRVLEVHNRVLAVGLKLVFLKQVSSLMLHPHIIEARSRTNALAMKLRKQRSRTGSVKTVVMIENTAVQAHHPLQFSSQHS